VPFKYQVKRLQQLREKLSAVDGSSRDVHDFQDKRNHTRTIDDFAAEMIGQVLEGAWDTDTRAGMIGEVGCQAPWTELERRVMQGALIAQQETGAAINVHPGRHEANRHQP
jgi:phosphotriesterase-related protein